MAETFGPLDCLLSLGAHEYPFSLADVRQAGVTRSIVRSYNVHPSYEVGFRRFMQAIMTSWSDVFEGTARWRVRATTVVL